jgi:hypothetical protein
LRSVIDGVFVEAVGFLLRFPTPPATLSRAAKAVFTGREGDRPPSAFLPDLNLNLFELVVELRHL